MATPSRRVPENPSASGSTAARSVWAMARQILVLNGPNLNLLGTREPDVYGADTLDDILAELRAGVAGRDVELSDAQSNSEGDLIDALHAARSWADGVVFNPGAYTHTSIALRRSVTC